MADRLELRRRLPASPERVFAAWTDPALLARWMSPFAEAEASVNVRVGGTFAIVMRGQGQEIRHTGTYLEVDPPHRLVFTWQSPYTGDQPSLVTLSLALLGEQTELTLIHDQLPPGQGDSHRGGWGQILDNLAALLEQMATSGRHG
jgi:uncharacterized protein YndB with AHSA1/START domain